MIPSIGKTLCKLLTPPTIVDTFRALMVQNIFVWDRKWYYEKK